LLFCDGYDNFFTLESTYGFYQAVATTNFAGNLIATLDFEYHPKVTFPASGIIRIRFPAGFILSTDLTGKFINSLLLFPACFSYEL